MMLELNHITARHTLAQSRFNAVSYIASAGRTESENAELTFRNQSHSLVLFDDKHLESVSDFDMSLRRTGEGVRH